MPRFLPLFSSLRNQSFSENVVFSESSVSLLQSRPEIHASMRAQSTSCIIIITYTDVRNARADTHAYK